MNRILACLALATFPILTVAQTPSGTVTRVTECAKLPDQAQRLACFDREVAELAKATGTAVAAPAARVPAPAAGRAPAVAAAPAPAPAAATPPAVPKAPGLLSRAKSAVGSVFTGVGNPPPATAAVAAPRPVPKLGEEQIKRPIVSPDQDPEGRMDARITALRETRPEVFVFTLDNGQVWRQDEPRYGFDPQVDDAVTVRKASLGSYRLNLDKDGSKNWIRVARVR